MVEARRTISRSQMYFCVRGVKYYGEPTLLWFRWTVCIGDLSKIQEWKGSTLMRLQEETWHKRLWKWIWTRWAPGHSRDGSWFLIEKISQVEERTRYSWQRDDAGQVLISGKQRLVWQFRWKASFWPRREVRVVFFSHIVIEQWAEYPLVFDFMISHILWRLLMHS